MTGDDSTQNAASPVDVDAMIADAFRRVEAFDWSQWTPDLDDQLLGPKWYTDKPPLTMSMVSLYADFLGWINGRTLPPDEFENLKQTLGERWTNAGVSMDYSGVSDILAGIALWVDVVQRRLPPEHEKQARAQLRAKMADGVLGELPKAPAGREDATTPFGPNVTAATAGSAMQAKLFQDLLRVQAGRPTSPPGFFPT